MVGTVEPSCQHPRCIFSRISPRKPQSIGLALGGRFDVRGTNKACSFKDMNCIFSDAAMYYITNNNMRKRVGNSSIVYIRKYYIRP